MREQFQLSGWDGNSQGYIYEGENINLGKNFSHFLTKTKKKFAFLKVNRREIKRLCHDARNMSERINQKWG